MRKRSGFPSSEADYARLTLAELDAEIWRLETHQRAYPNVSSSLRKNVEESLHRLKKYRAKAVEAQAED